MGPKIESRSVLLGRDLETSAPIALGSEGHVLTFAPTGAGKGVSALIPALLTHPGQAIVLDCKGEAVAVTRRYRERDLGQKVIVLDPFCVTGGPTCRFNPFDLLPADPKAAGLELQSFSEMLAPCHEHTGDPYWDIAGRQLIRGLLALYVEQTPAGERTIEGFLDHEGRLFTQPGVLSNEMARATSAEARSQAALVEDLMTSTRETARDVVSHADTLLSGLRGRVTASATAATDFDLEALQDGEPMTIYVVVPPNRMKSAARLLRVWLSALSSILTRRRERPATSTLLLIDEAAQLGDLEFFVAAMTLYRGYGIQCWSFWQDLSQLRSIYPRHWETIINNAEAIQLFGISCSSMASDCSSIVPSEPLRALLSMKPDHQVIARSGSVARIYGRVSYLADACLASRAGLNPYFAA